MNNVLNHFIARNNWKHIKQAICHVQSDSPVTFVKNVLVEPIISSKSVVLSFIQVVDFFLSHTYSYLLISDRICEYIFRWKSVKWLINICVHIVDVVFQIH